MYGELKFFVLCVMLTVYVMTCAACVLYVRIMMRVMLDKVDSMIERIEARADRLVEKSGVSENGQTGERADETQDPEERGSKNGIDRKLFVTVHAPANHLAD